MTNNEQWGKGITELGDAILAAYPSKSERKTLKEKVATQQGREAMAVTICTALYPKYARVRELLKSFGVHPSSRRSAAREALRYVNTRLNTGALV